MSAAAGLTRGSAGSDEEAPPRDFHRRWPTLKPPLRPDATVVTQVADLLTGIKGPVLLLGVTPELAAIERHMVAVDWSEKMIALAWPGDTARRQAVRGDWKALPLADDSMAAAMSDGALTMLRWPDEAAVMLSELARVLRPGGRAVIRCFATPDVPETLAALGEVAARGDVPFHEWRLRFNMAAARADGQVAITSARLFEHYDAALPDRMGKALTQGWPVEALAEIDAYRGSAYIHCYPKRSELAALLAGAWPGSWRFAETAGYPGAAHCPLLVLDRA